MVRFLDLRKITDACQPALDDAISRVIRSGVYVRGPEVTAFESAFAGYIGTRHCVGVGNGLDALRLILKAWIRSGVLQEGDEVIVPANTYIASILAVTDNRLKPVFVEPDIATLLMDPQAVAAKITPRTRVIMVVHLYGRNAMDPRIKALAQAFKLKILEDNAQAAGCMWGDRRTGAVGDAAAHSFFPTKNLGALGDGGAVTTDDETLAETIRTLANYGSREKGLNELAGVNSRLDELQAAVLGVKLARLDRDNERRRAGSAFYIRHIRHPDVVLPSPPASAEEHVWHLFVIRVVSDRDALQRHLLEHGVETLIHYPVPPHKQQGYREWSHLSLPVTEMIHRQVLSLPLNPVITDAELAKVAAVLDRFPRKGETPGKS